MKKAPTTWKSDGAGEQLSFLPLPQFCPTQPARGTLADKALKMLLTGEEIDHPTFERRTKSWRLSAVVFKLKSELNWPIESIPIPSPTDQDPARVISLYRLDASFITLMLTAGAG
jgi:hypothetical protein